MWGDTLVQLREETTRAAPSSGFSGFFLLSCGRAPGCYHERMSGISRLCALAIGAAICACDGGGDAPTATTSLGACDPARQDCPAGQTCDLVCESESTRLMCRTVPNGGGVAAGGACSVTSGCAARTGCFATAGVPASCVQYCDTNADCSRGTCQARWVTRPCGVAPRFMLKFCLP